MVFENAKIIIFILIWNEIKPGYMKEGTIYWCEK